MAKYSTRTILVRKQEAQSQILYSSSSSASSPHGFAFVFTLFLSCLLFTFSEASRPLTTLAFSPSSSSSSSSATNSPTLSPFKTHHAIHVDHKFFILLITLFSLVSLVLIMAIFKCFGFKLKRNRNRDETVADFDENMKMESEVKRFTWNEIARLTDDFSTVIGSGGYSNVYLAHSPESDHRFWAIKMHNGSERLHQVFKQELDILLNLDHTNIVKLLGYYCDEQDEGALVFEHVANGNLQEILHGGNDDQRRVLPWRNRMQIAYEIASAIEYLHEKCDMQIVHMDIKASNVLLDTNLNAKLCDFGSAKMGFSSVIAPPSPTLKKQFLMMGSPGYTDPHYIRTGFASKKNDVYSFGVLLLELVTGREAFCVEEGRMLTSVVGQREGFEEEAEVVAGMVDCRLEGFDAEEARAMLKLAATCLRQSPTLRPSVTQILRTITDSVSCVVIEESPRKLEKSYS